MGKALYRKYRSKSLSDLIGQSHITDTLKRAIDSNKISHAYLFTGPRGVGKTSVARIVAHEINSLEYNEDEQTHLDIIEIDAASNRGIDEIRELRDKVHVAPTSAKYKVYIIDEVHMLTRDAFNALLKTLEEPPKHAVFILATTEAHKLPDTIISRTQRHTFKPVSKDLVVAHLAHISENENIKASQEALELLAEHGEGSFRDSISLLDQMSSVADEITDEDVRSSLGLAENSLVKQTITAVKSKDKKSIDDAFSSITDKGVNIVLFAEQLSAELRTNLLDDGHIDSDQLLLLEELSEIGATNNPRISLLTALYRPLAKQVVNSVQIERPNVEEEPTISSTQSEDLPPQEENNEEETKPDEIIEDQQEYTVQETNDEMDTPQDTDEWQQILNALKGKHNTLYGLVRMAKPVITEDELVLEFQFPFHERRLKDDKNRKLVEKVIKTELKRQLLVKSRVKSNAKHEPPKPKLKTQANKNIKNISNIFGGAEVVES